MYLSTGKIVFVNARENIADENGKEVTDWRIRRQSPQNRATSLNILVYNQPPYRDMNIGTNVSYYTNFINTVMDEMDKCLQQFKGLYVTMDNSPIHSKNSELSLLIKRRVYKRVYLPSYLPELNLIEQLRVAAKRKVRCNQFGNTEDLKTRNIEACNQVFRKQFVINVFENCLNERLV